MEYQTFFRVPQLTDTVDADVQFFPEGGYLLAGIRSQINLKAVGTDGFGIDIYGCIYGKTTGMVTPFASSHRGMGRFTFEVKEGEEYYAMVKMPDGTEKKVELPQVKTTGIILHAEVSDSVIRYSCPATPEFHAEKKLYVLVHCRRKLIAINRAGPFWNGILPVKELPPGIVQGVLIDEDGKIYSSRMSFIFPEEKQNLTIQTGKQKYHKRDCVLLSVSFIGKDTLSCSVAVTDSLLAPEKRWDKNIVNYFLLSSDLKGQVETPGWYFDRTIPFPYRKRMMDIMLATQGWQRFDVEKATQGIGKPMPFFLELSQAISGVIRNYWGKKAKNPKLFAIAPQLNLLKQVEVDSNSRFLLNVQFPEKTTFIFQALTAKNSKWVELFIDNDSLRPPQNPLFPEKIILTDTSQEKKSFPTEQEFSKVPTTGVYYNEGRKIYMLREAEVVRRNDSTYLGNFEHIAEQILKARDIREENIHSLEEWIRKIPGA